jgi:hypothetical protein
MTLVRFEPAPPVHRRAHVSRELAAAEVDGLFQQVWVYEIQSVWRFPDTGFSELNPSQIND